MKWSSKVKSLKLFYMYRNQNTYKYILFLSCIIWKTENTYECGHNKNDTDIGLFDWEQTGLKETALYEDIIIIKKWNMKTLIYKFQCSKIG